jgi:quercetin 2,3-dioxygenase
LSKPIYLIRVDTSAGTGIRHSESNDNKRKNVHLLQIWYARGHAKCPYYAFNLYSRAKPSQAALKPAYYTRRFPSRLKQDTFLPLLVPAHSIPDVSVVPTQDITSPTPIPCFADLSMSASHISSKSIVTTTVHGKKAYLHFAMRSGYASPNATKRNGQLVVKSDKGDVTLLEGDGIYITAPGKPCELVITNEGKGIAEVILVDM